MAYSTWGSFRALPPWRARSSIDCWRRNAACVSGPPSDFDLRELRTVEIVQQRWPELLDVAREGDLVIVEGFPGGIGAPETVIIVGTAHVSRVSALQVQRVIRAVRPDKVVVELCKSRIGLMYAEDDATNLLSLSGADRNAALARSFKLGGNSAFLLRLLLAGVSEKITKSAPASVGAEFRAARKAAKEIGAQLVLGDRPIEITLNRAWCGLSWKERLRLAVALWQTVAFAKVDVSEKTLQEMKSDDVLSTMFSEMGNQFPALLRYLVWERDLYLAWSLKRSKAVTGCKVVVGVIGKGHLRGVVYALSHSQEHLTFRDLVGQSTRIEFDLLRFFTSVILEGLLALLLWLYLS